MVGWPRGTDVKKMKPEIYEVVWEDLCPRKIFNRHITCIELDKSGKWVEELTILHEIVYQAVTRGRVRRQL